jgi:hypothetical protein
MTAGRLAFPARPPWPFSASPKLCGRAFEDSAAASATVGYPIVRILRGLCLLFEASFLPWPIPRDGKPPQLAGRLSWDSSVRPSIDILPVPGPSALPPPGRLGMPLPGPCRSRGFAPPQRITVPESRRHIAACCRSWGSSRFRACRLPPDESGGRAHRHSRDAVRTPRRIPSPIAAPRHRGRCTSCGSTDLRAPSDRFRSRTETPDAPADPMGSGRPIARPTSTHPPGGFHDDRSRREHPPGIDRAPWCGRVPFPPPLRAKVTEPGSTGESGPLQGLAPPTSSCRALRIGYRKRRQYGSSWASFPFKVLPASPLRARPTSPPPKREGASSSDPSSCRRVPCTL